MVNPNVPGDQLHAQVPAPRFLGVAAPPSRSLSISAIHRASPCARSTSLRAVFCGSATLTVVPCSCFGLRQPLSWCLLLPPGAQLPVWGGLDRDGRVHASARLLSLQPLGAEEGWRRRTAVPRPSRLLFVSRVSKREGALVPLRVGMETTLLPRGCCSPVFCVLCADPGMGSARFLPEASVPTWREHNL